MVAITEETNLGVQDKKIDEKIVEIIKKTEDNYRENFDAQAKLLKEITNKAMNLNDKDKSIKDLIKEKDSFNDPFTFILDFLGRGDKGKREIVKTILGNEWDKDNVLFLGIQNLTRSKRSHLLDKDIQKYLKNIFCSTNKETCLKDSLDVDSFKEFQKIFQTPTATATSVLYWLYPEQYIPFDKPTKRLLKKLLKIDKIEDTWTSYTNVIEALKNNNFYVNNEFKPSMIIALSYAAYLENNSVENILDKLLDNNDKPKNIILTGIPGTGKTHAVKEYVKTNNIEHEFIQFHPSYDYEDFIEGLKPVPKDGQISFELVDGQFKKLCKKAYENFNNDKEETKPYVMIIDEINRANLSRVFGELLYCLEYRGEFVSTKMTTYINSLEDKKEYSINENNEEHIGKFTIPKNVIVLGTMNEVDRSIDAFDLALRRRFIWEDIGFSETALRLYQPFFQKNFQKNIDALIKKSTTLNEQLSKDIGANYQLGHTYYFKIIDYFNDDFESALCDLWEYHIKSIVREYCKIKYGEHEINSKLNEYREIIVGKNSCDG